MLESHLQQQARAHVDGNWHAVQNDINDELNDAANRIRMRCGDAEAERFLRLYAEEVLAWERDAMRSPATMARRFYGGDVTAQSQLPPPKRNGAGWAVLVACLIAGIAIGVIR
jgi:hypothetical protein